jgi:hypothetical protein
MEPMNGPQLHEIYQLVRDNNKMLHAMRRNAFWGGLFRLVMYLAFIGVPIWLYFSYLAPIVKQMDATLSAATGKKIQLEGQIGDWAKTYEEYKARFTGATSSSSTK